MKRTSALILIAMVISVLAFTVPALAVPDDSIASQHIGEADGVSGQDTNTGSGIKTGHIQDGAVTDAKISGPISASKISSAGLDADTLDGKHASDFAGSAHDHDAVYQRLYNNVLVVSTDGNGDFTSPVDAVNAITDASVSNPYLIRIMPGVYNIGTGTIVMKSYVDMRGSGEDITKITGAYDDGNTGTTGLLIGASYSEVSDLTVENTSAGLGTTAIFNLGQKTRFTRVTAITTAGTYERGILNKGYNAQFRDVTATTSGSGNSNEAINNQNQATFVHITATAINGNYNHGFYNFRTFGNRVFMESVTVLAAGGDVNVALSDYDSSSDMVNVRATAQGGANDNIGFENYSYQCTFCTATVEHSAISGTNTILRNIALYNNYTSLFIADSKLDGGQFYLNGAQMKCIGTYSSTFDPVTCP